MQTSPLPQSWTEARLLIFGVLLGLIPTFVNRWLDRKKTGIEQREAEARTDLHRVTVDSVVIRDSIATGEGVSKMLATLIDAGDTIKQLQDRVFELEQEALEDAMAKLHLKKAKALLDYHEIPFAEADQPEVRRLIEKSNSKSKGSA